MGIISAIGRKSYKVRFLIAAMYAVLAVGAVTMIYPFSLMVSGSTKSNVDKAEMAIIPKFMTDDTELYRKSVEGFFNERTQAMVSTYGIMSSDFKKLVPPETSEADFKLESEWIDFINSHELPFYTYGLSYMYCPLSRQTVPLNMRKFKSVLYDKYEGNIEAMNRALSSDFPAWHSIFVPQPDYLVRIEMPNFSDFMMYYREFKVRQPQNMRYYASVEGFFKAVFLKALYTKSIENYNKAHKTNYASWNQVLLPREYPAGKEYSDKQRSDWLDFTRNLLSTIWIRADQAAAPLFREYLKARYEGNIKLLNELYDTQYDSFEQIFLYDDAPLRGRQVVDWTGFIQGWRDPKTNKQHILPKEMIRIHSIDFMFRDYLREKYKSLDGINRAVSGEYTNILQIFPPQQLSQYLYIKRHKSMLRREFIKRNFVSVSDYIILHGRGVLNTFIYCSLAIFFALIVNPLAAYALSRYKPPSQYKVLLFLMLTMAFPPMVMQIPTFLMLREFDLLNTFAALLLPGLANGYSIFLLKGFFDSLPRELYESAELDGAGEVRIFLQITMNLSKPILAVIALTAFNNAYANFMMALLICQDEKMWTLMPWLYQLQQKSGDGVIFASLLIAAVPTFIIFVLCQNIIMRGIVVPTEK